MVMKMTFFYLNRNRIYQGRQCFSSHRLTGGSDYEIIHRQNCVLCNSICMTKMSGHIKFYH